MHEESTIYLAKLEWKGEDVKKNLYPHIMIIFNKQVHKDLYEHIKANAEGTRGDKFIYKGYLVSFNFPEIFIDPLDQDDIKYFLDILEDIDKAVGSVTLFTTHQIVAIKRFLINKDCLIKSFYIYVYKDKPYWVDFYGNLIFIEPASIGLILQVLKQKNIFETN